RINRIFEGTNEINRLLIPATLMRKAMKGEIPLLAAAQKLAGELMSMMPSFDEPTLLGEEGKLVENAKKIFLMCAGTAVQKFGTKLKDQQVILARLADIIIEIFAMESCLKRALKAVAATGEEANLLKVDMTRYYVNMTFPKIEMIAKEILAAVETGDILRTQLSALKKLTRFTPINSVELVDKIAAPIIKNQKYSC
ncbi:MAG: acyl-CoA dehydrogenase, partial [Bacillota bacterium]|nr:acyl-CoA dehydrogenase [Bacillota bacterium]